MDANTATVWNTAIQVGGTLLGVFLGFALGLVTEWLRHRREDKTRYAPEKRALYVRALAASARVQQYIEAFVRLDPDALKKFDEQVDEFDVLHAELLAIAPASVFDAVSRFVQAITRFFDAGKADDQAALAQAKSDQADAFEQILLAIRKDLKTKL